MKITRGPRGARLLWAGAAAFLGWKLAQRMLERSLEGQVVLITGGSRGLGLELARALIPEGCPLVICARDPEELKAAEDDLAERGAEVLAVQCDVADRVQVSRMIAQSNERFGRIDVVVNNASVIQAAPLEALSIEDFEEAMGSNYWGTVYTTLEVLPQMRERGRGRIVNITSIGGKVAIPHLLPYDAAKFATVGFSEGLRSEVAADGILVTTVVPGLMRTGSPVNAFFKGDPEMEFSWFSLASATPLTTISVKRAARRIILAAKRGEAEVTLSWQARILRLTHDLFPGTTVRLLGVADRMLPRGSEVTENVRGMKLSTAVSPSPLTRWMTRAARRTHQYAGRPRPSPGHAEAAGLKEDE